MSSADIASWAQAFAALVGLLFVWYQIRQATGQARDALQQDRVAKTIEACDRYDSDPLIDAALRKLSKDSSSGKLKKNPASDKIELVTVMNYFDGIAICLRESVFDEAIAKEQIGEIMIVHYRDLVSSGIAVQAGIKMTDYANLTALVEKWQ